MSDYTPSPGSHAARQAGCRCDAVCNGYGAGIPGSERHTPLFEVRASCTIHGNGSGYVWSPRPWEEAPVMAPWADEVYQARRLGRRPKKAA